MYFIVGANGFLGSYITKAVLENTNESIVATARDLSRVFLESPRVSWISCDMEAPGGPRALAKSVNGQSEPCKVVYLAAYHHPDEVAKNPEKARAINVTALNEFLSSSSNIQRVFYASTDSVYGESEGGYHFKENDAKYPVNEYGRQKAQAEQVTLAHGGNAVRFPFLIAPSLLRHKKHFYDAIAESFLEGREVELFSDSYRSSLDFGTAAELLVRLAETPGKIPDVVNLSGDEDLSKYDVGVLIAKKLGVSTALAKPIRLCDKEEFSKGRAGSTLLCNALAKRTLGLSEIRIHI